MTIDDVESALKDLSASSGFDISLDENGACTLELSDGRPVVLQLRSNIDELDFVALLGEVPGDVRADVFESLLSANYYWQKTMGATLSWNPALEQVVLIYPLPLAGATQDALVKVFERFLELQAAWRDRLAELASEARSGDAPDVSDATDAPAPGMIINP